MHAFAVYVKEGLPIACLLISRKLCGILRFQLALLHLVSYSFFLHQSPSLLLYTVFDSIPSK